MGRRSDGPGSLLCGVGCLRTGGDTQAGSDVSRFSWSSSPLQSAVAAPSPVMGSMAPNDAMAAGPMAPGFFQGPPGSQQPPHNPNAPMMGPHVQPFMSPRFPGGPRPTLRMPSQPPVGLPGSQPLLPGTMEPSPRAQGHPSMGPMQRVTPPRGMASVGPQSYGGGMRPPPNSLAGPGLPTMNMGPGVRGPWASPSGNSVRGGLAGQGRLGGGLACGGRVDCSQLPFSPDSLFLFLPRQLLGTPRRRRAPWNTHHAQPWRLQLQREHVHYHEPHWAGRRQG